MRGGHLLTGTSRGLRWRGSSCLEAINLLMFGDPLVRLWSIPAIVLFYICVFDLTLIKEIFLSLLYSFRLGMAFSWIVDGFQRQV